ncbi:MAG TPA: potassium transporter TrkG [Acidimicrobiales bacterium]|nr:potassium transporter TrkG [Acidimicrobiales bacterium]
MPALRGRRPLHPARFAALMVVFGFMTAATLGTLMLTLPFATASGRSTSLLDAAFTATSAVCVTGLIVVDTPSHWTPFGEGVILALIQIGGFGIMTMTSLVVVLLSKRLGLRHRLVARAETGTLEVGDVRQVLFGVARFSISVELVMATLLFARFWIAYDESPGRAAYLGLFHSISAFNNAGFSLFSDSLASFTNDPFVLLSVAMTVIVGGLGYPVWVDIARRPRYPSSWSLHSKITVSTTVGLLSAGTILLAWFEWTNTGTLGEMSVRDSTVNAFFHSAMPRTAGFNSLDIASMNEPGRFLTEILMFIGGGSASTAGGIKVTTFAVLGWVMWAEVRGDPDVVAFGRRIPEAAQRQALTVGLMAVGGVVVSTMLMMAWTPLPRSDLFFEVVSALGTVGLSTGVTPLLSTQSQVLTMALMLVGRIGPITLLIGLVLRERARRYRHATERPIIG